MFGFKNLRIRTKVAIIFSHLMFMTGVVPLLSLVVGHFAFDATPSGLIITSAVTLAIAGSFAGVAGYIGFKKGILEGLESLSSWTAKASSSEYIEPPCQDRQDEIGALSREFRDLYTSLAKEIEQSKFLMKNLAETVEKVTVYSTEVLSISNEQATGANEQATAVQEASTTSKEIAVTAKEITSTALSVLEMSENGSQACSKGMEAVERAIDGMKDLQRQVQSVATRMVELGENSQRIGEVLSIIEEISDRTNLLALNAAIEAASAGEAGKRFGVVASEIRNLAERTSQSTKDIKLIIEKIQTSTNNTIMVTEQGLKAVQTSFDLVNMVGDAFGHIEEQVNDTMRASKEITFSTQQQTSACEQMAVTISEVSTVAEHFVKGTEDIANSLAEMSTLSEKLSALMKETGAVEQ